MLTEPRIRSIAQANALDVEKSITTGNATRHFATFRLTGTFTAIAHVWNAIRDEVPRGFGGCHGTPENADYPDRRPYIEISSVWCDTSDACEPTAAR